MFQKAINVFIAVLLFSGLSNCQSEQKFTHDLWSVKFAESFLARHPGAVTYDQYMTKDDWNYEQGLMLESLRKMYYYTGEKKYYRFIKDNLDQYINEDGSIRTYKLSDYNIDNIKPAGAVLFVYQITGEEKYKIALDTLYKQLINMPRTESGGFWHKKIYPYQMWLDGLYMGQPFYAEYSKVFNLPENFDDITHQVKLVYEKTLDKETGLLYHAWDESRQQKWADPETGKSPHFWGRAIGWYMMALVDVLDFLPQTHPDRQAIIDILNQQTEALLKVRDDSANVWYQVLNMHGREGNYLEASASCMFVYAIAKGVNNGYLPEKYLAEAQKSFEGILKQFVKLEDDGYYNLYGTCRGAGLGGKPYRDGSYEYYISEPTRINDFKGYGPLIMAAMELEKADALRRNQTKVALDNYFNNEYRKNKATGQLEPFHYIWEDTTDSGYYELGKLFTKYGAKISELKEAPTAGNLADSDVYIIVDPDTEKETEKPNYIGSKDVKNINEWVRNGGILLILANDKGNCEFEHLNKLANNFGFTFNEVSLNRVDGKKYDMGAFVNLPFNPVFAGVDKIYMKEISTINNPEPVETLLKKEGQAVMIFKKVGKGYLFAVGDPWIYNEYIDNRRLPEDFQNYRAAENWVKWILQLDYVSEN
ncbi:glycosyl hydrolase family 88 [Melioribacter roseus P3M-2]|uniref:Glycosyl hydrolase family 88 n=1 Tax=Melioribacter roseus (strain DSM 23840 / JCM 17771 / VKM B-2668 / P3M-2) TaxID=1191523 RepID=I6ZU93_MELRP|nr:glycoside hydrolase family 88 protein [Melioribacter roseus]AFN75579.1 glycosyl hydrolase family 88 [Melioribacter roseus P3M-2]